MQETIKKTPIGQIRKKVHKVTIADEVELSSKYHIEPPLKPWLLARCWLDPSEIGEAQETHFYLIYEGGKQKINKSLVDLLKIWLKPEALESIFKIEERTSFKWCKVKRKVLRKYNLTGLFFNSLANTIHSITIASRQPLYDPDAHPNRVRNVLRAVKVQYPSVHFEHEECYTSGQCPIGLQAAMRKLALETHGKLKEEA